MPGSSIEFLERARLIEVGRPRGAFSPSYLTARLRPVPPLPSQQGPDLVETRVVTVDDPQRPAYTSPPQTCGCPEE